jgi:hypothetical protein
MEISKYKWLFELTEYLFGGNDYDKSRIADYELEKQLFENLNISKVHKKAFEILAFLNSKKENLNNKPQQTTPTVNNASKKETKKLNSFNDFFIETTPEKIESIKNQYRNLTNGKSLAYLIYLLQNEFKIINYSLRGSADSRKQFIKSLTGIQYKSTEFVNKYFNANEVTLNINTINDTNYNLIKNKIQSILDPNLIVV